MSNTIRQTVIIDVIEAPFDVSLDDPLIREPLHLSWFTDFGAKEHSNALQWAMPFDMLRHGFLARVIRNEWNARGMRGLLTSIRNMSGGKNAAIAAKYRALEELPLGTLGRHYIAYMEANQFTLPGELKGAPRVPSRISTTIVALLKSF